MKSIGQLFSSIKIYFVQKIGGATLASALVDACGGKDNIKHVGLCATKLRLQVEDPSIVSTQALKDLGAVAALILKDEVNMLLKPKNIGIYEEIKKIL